MLNVEQINYIQCNLPVADILYSVHLLLADTFHERIDLG